MTDIANPTGEVKTSDRAGELVRKKLVAETVTLSVWPTQCPRVYGPGATVLMVTVKDGLWSDSPPELLKV